MVEVLERVVPHLLHFVGDAAAVIRLDISRIDANGLLAVFANLLPWIEFLVASHTVAIQYCAALAVRHRRCSDGPRVNMVFIYERYLDAFRTLTV